MCRGCGQNFREARSSFSFNSRLSVIIVTVSAFDSTGLVAMLLKQLYDIIHERKSKGQIEKNVNWKKIPRVTHGRIYVTKPMSDSWD